MDIIVKNGVLRIKGSAAERKAFATVQAGLRQIAEFGGKCGIGDAASACHMQVEDFLKLHGDAIEWPSERNETAAP